MSKEIKRMSEIEIIDARVRDAIKKAASNGIVDFITIIARANPGLIWTHDVATTVFKNAITCREAKVFSLIYGLGDKEALANFVDKETRTTMLHMVGEVPSTQVINLIPGSALQMQRELQWFKEVESFAGQAIEIENQSQQKPRDVFTDRHETMMSNGERWMKETSQSCTIVGALIVTIMFTAAFTVPGGNNQDSGYPIFSKKILFKIFIFSDAISLFSSTTSVLTFLGILTSRYTEDDFLSSLPTKMIIGLCTLILSLLTMMIAFCAALSIMFRAKLWIVIPVASFASIPVVLFLWIQSRPLRQMIMSTFGPSIFDRKVKPWLYDILK
ncbi:ankyrin repeat-containing protein ITN1-like [Humulus lupulus]|uniref:ankyrin repeat-containing protein ITN1-like n=1 Tax=Humulus lupulus TaxID=3486 RepID=UPI002B40A57F|nr:ankyrin repeat-containing protein ITN1-like [Humulus lupulus]